ncbi:MAG: hypothetical protein WB565_06675 [Acidimicrobiales bacterium]
MPAVIIRLLDSLHHIVEYTIEPGQRSVLLRQADMILRSAESSVEEENDLEDIRVRYADLVTTTRRMRNRRDLAIEPG